MQLYEQKEKSSSRNNTAHNSKPNFLPCKPRATSRPRFSSHPKVPKEVSLGLSAAERSTDTRGREKKLETDARRSFSKTSWSHRPRAGRLPAITSPSARVYKNRGKLKKTRLGSY